MSRRQPIWVLSLTLAAAAVAPSEPDSDPEAVRLIERVIDAHETVYWRQWELAYTETTRIEKLEKDGTLQKVESERFRVTPATGGERRELLSRNGRPLTDRDRKREAERLAQERERTSRMTPEERAEATRKKLDERVKRYRERLSDALEVFRFERLPDEVASGQTLRAFRFEPRPDYRARSRDTRIMARMAGTVWIDAERDQLARLELELVENVDFLKGVFGRLAKGSTALATARLSQGLWLLEDVEVSFKARLYFLKSYRQRIVTGFSEYRREPVDLPLEIPSEPARPPR